MQTKTFKNLLYKAKILHKAFSVLNINSIRNLSVVKSKIQFLCIFVVKYRNIKKKK